jgi:hypothetical protein
MTHLSMRLSGMKVKLAPVKFKPKTLTYILIVGFFVIGGFYIYIVNAVANKGTELNTLTQSNKELESANARLETEAARLSSLQVIDQNASGEVTTGDQESKPTQIPGQPTGTGAADVEAQSVTVAPVTPKLVQIKSQVYLPSYENSLAAR